MSVPQLESLLVEARELILENDVTGALLYSESNFMQNFEGFAPVKCEPYYTRCL